MSKNTAKTTPADEAVNITTTTVAADGNTTTLESTGDPVIGQASTVDNAPNVTTPAATLPKDYLANGYYATTNKGKYLRPEFVGEYAEIMAALLSNMTPGGFNALIREMKRSRTKSLPFEARVTAAIEMLPKAMALVRAKKAPPLLVTFIKENLDHLHDDDDWFAYMRFLTAIGNFLAAQSGGEN